MFLLLEMVQLETGTPVNSFESQNLTHKSGKSVYFLNANSVATWHREYQQMTKLVHGTAIQHHPWGCSSGALIK